MTHTKRHITDHGNGRATLSRLRTRDEVLAQAGIAPAPKRLPKHDPITTHDRYIEVDGRRTFKGVDIIREHLLVGWVFPYDGAWIAKAYRHDGGEEKYVAATSRDEAIAIVDAATREA